MHVIPGRERNYIQHRSGWQVVQHRSCITKSDRSIGFLVRNCPDRREHRARKAGAADDLNISRAADGLHDLNASVRISEPRNIWDGSTWLVRPHLPRRLVVDIAVAAGSTEDESLFLWRIHRIARCSIDQLGDVIPPPRLELHRVALR